MWTKLFAALPAHADSRIVERLEARMAERGGTSNFWTKLDACITAVIPKLREPAHLPNGWESEVTQLRKQIAALAKGPAPDDLRRLESPAAHTIVSHVELELVGGSAVVTVGSNNPGNALWDAAFVVDAFNPDRSPLAAGDLTSFELRLGVLDRIQARCDVLRCPLTIVQGEFPTRHINAHRVHL